MRQKLGGALPSLFEIAGKESSASLTVIVARPHGIHRRAALSRPLRGPLDPLFGSRECMRRERETKRRLSV